MGPGRDSNFEAARRFAEFGLREKAAGRRDSASGPGSSTAATADALRFLRKTITEHRITSILDLGCGDWHWMRELGLPRPVGDADVSYQGWDASPAMTEQLNARYGTDGVSFHTRDITTEPLPKVDLVIARDVLFHIDIAIVTALVARIREAAPYFASTSFNTVRRNGNIQHYKEAKIEGWGFHKVNLDIAPLDLAPFKVDEVHEAHGDHTGDKRYFCLYRFGA
jgi:SAM-dependent methyltransferase